METKTVKKLLRKFNSKRVTMPILQYALCYFENGHVVGLEASDLSSKISAGRETSISTCVSIQNILSLDDVNQLRLADKTAHGEGFTFQTIGNDEYPNVFKSFQALDNKAILGKLEIDALLDHVCKDETRFNLCGAHFSKLGCVVTDNHRILSTTLEANMMGNVSKIVPTEFLELCALLPEQRLCFQFSEVEDLVRVESSGVIITARNIDGTFPDYSKHLLAAKSGNSLDLGSISKLVMGFLKSLPKQGKKDGPICVEVEKGEHLLTFACKLPDFERKINIPINAGPTFRIGLNAEFLKNALEHEFYVWETQSKENPNIFTGNVGTLLVMPIRLEDAPRMSAKEAWAQAKQAQQKAA